MLLEEPEELSTAGKILTVFNLLAELHFKNHELSLWGAETKIYYQGLVSWSGGPQ